jgi:uncharacterized membrane protein
MNVISTAIDKIEELIGHSPHPAMTDLPIGAWMVSNISDVMGLLTGDEAYDDSARISMGVGLLGAAGAVVTGIRDYSYIPRDRQPNHEVATRHALGNAVVGTLFAASYFLRSSDEAAGQRPGLAARLLGLSGGGLMLYTAWLGGKLVQELGEGVRPVMEAQEQQELRAPEASRPAPVPVGSAR